MIAAIQVLSEAVSQIQKRLVAALPFTKLSSVSLRLTFGTALSLIVPCVAMAATYNYSNTTSGSVPDDQASCTSVLTRTFNVADSFTVDDLNVGVVIDHSYKGDLIVSLESPLGTQLSIINTVGGSNQDYNVRLDDEAAQALSTINHDDTVAYPQFIRQPTNSLSTFDGESANGTWTMRVCDTQPADFGTFYAAYLEFTGTPSTAPLVVTSTADTNTLGTLRYAINHANANAADDDITFNISGLGPHVISPTSVLPAITDNGVSIDGSTQGSTVCGGPTNSTGGLTNRKHRVVLYGSGHADHVLIVNGASDVIIKALTIGNGTQAGLYADGADGLTLLCNHFGASTDTSGDIGNTGDGARINDSDNVVIGDGTLAGANVFGFNGDEGLELSTNTPGNGVSIRRNFIGVGINGVSDIGNGDDGLTIGGWSNVTVGDAAGGGNIISGNNNDGLYIILGSSVTALGNFIGTNAIGTASIPNGDEGVQVQDTGSTASVGDGTSGGANIIAGNVNDGVFIQIDASVSLDGNLIGVGSGGQLLGNGTGIQVASNATAQITGNQIANHTDEGIEVISTAGTVAIYSNNIYNNGEEAIDLNNDGVTANDSGDVDAGANDLLNFPVINEVAANGTAVEYDVDLDVPANTNGYRIEFFKTSDLVTQNGEGDTYLGFIDTGNHAGGNVNYTGTFTANETVSVGNIISATTTRKTGASSYDITSEFSGNEAAASAVSPLVVINTNDSGAGSLRDAITFANANAGEDDITFDIPGTGPHVISPTSVLPSITDTGITIDGSTQDGAVCADLWGGTQHTLKIRIDSGSGTNPSYDGLSVNAANVTIKGLSITRFDDGIRTNAAGDNLIVQCNYVGLTPDGTSAGNYSDGIALEASDGALIGGLTAGQGNVVSANRRGVKTYDLSTATIIRGNFIGTDPAGTAARANTNYGVVAESGTVTWADVTGNLVSGNTAYGVYVSGSTLSGSSGDLIIAGNYVGVDRTGNTALANGFYGLFMANSTTSGIRIGGTTTLDRNIISGNNQSGIILNAAEDIDIIGNYFGLGADGITTFSDSGGGSNANILLIGATNIRIGNAATSGRNYISGGHALGIYSHSNSADIAILGNHIGLDTTGSVIGNRTFSAALLATEGHVGDGSAGGANIIAGSPQGVVLNTGSEISIIGNSIYDHAGIGINLVGGTEDGDGITANDSGDGDAGPNSLLNFPEINAFTSDGAMAITYDFDLDVPSNGNGYRIDFYKDNSALVTDNGEGEIHLGFVDIAHAGGDLNFTGSFTALATVTVGDIISATTTRKTGASSYDITSEFSGNEEAVSAADPLIVTSTADTNTLGTLRYAIHHANANSGDDDITFNISGGGPHTIALTSALPWITDADVSIDGTSQSGASCGDLWAGTPHTLMIRIDGPGSSYIAFTPNAANILIKGVSITGVVDAVRFRESSSNSILQCSYIGLSPDGTPDGNSNVGVATNGSSGTLVGGLTAGQGNVISSNIHGIYSDNAISGLMVRGNFIGTDPLGTTARANTTTTIGHFSDTGTWSDITKNLISGNSSHGIFLQAAVTITGSSGDVVIAGNHIGVDREGNTPLANGGEGINFETGSISGVTIGGTSESDRNVIASNTGNGIEVSTLSNLSILGNYIGLGADGDTDLGNGAAGIYFDGVTDMDVGDGTSGGRNVISGNTGRGIFSNINGSTRAVINGNYIGLAADGETSRVNGGGDAISISNLAVTDMDIFDNVIVGNSESGIEFFNTSGSGLRVQGNTIGLTASGAAASSLTGTDANASSGGVFLNSGFTATGVEIGGTGAGEGNTIAGVYTRGVLADSGAAAEVFIAGNIIRDTVGGPGIAVTGSGSIAIYANSIYDNDGLGIDINDDDAALANDIGDSDSGANDRLNFPVINSISAVGTTIYYDFDLDTVSNLEGYRIDFYSNSAADASLHGEGETHLGFIDISHAGGDLNFTGDFVSTETIAEGTIISATTTRKTGGSTYDVTSEFSLNYTSEAAASLTAAKSVSVFDPTAAGLYALPGNDIISSMLVTNAGSGAADTDTIVIIDEVPSEMIFYNGDMDDGGPATNPVYFTQTGGAGLTFTYGTDAAYSDSMTRPTNMAGCAYTPSLGYDSNVTYVCFNPKGAMAAGDPDPTFTLQFRARIK